MTGPALASICGAVSAQAMLDDDDDPGGRPAVCNRPFGHDGDHRETCPDGFVLARWSTLPVTA